MIQKPYIVEVASRIEKLRHGRRFIYFTETCMGSDGIERVYGYAIDGAVYMLNVGYVKEQLEAKS